MKEWQDKSIISLLPLSRPSEFTAFILISLMKASHFLLSMVISVRIFRSFCNIKLIVCTHYFLSVFCHFLWRKRPLRCLWECHSLLKMSLNDLHLACRIQIENGVSSQVWMRIPLKLCLIVYHFNLIMTSVFCEIFLLIFCFPLVSSSSMLHFSIKDRFYWRVD